jgi:hypothetical protein
MNRRTIHVAGEFARFPFGRYKTDGKTSGEVFRQEVLLPAIKDDTVVVVDLNGTRPMGSSWLEEAFGGLVRKDNFTLEFLQDHLKIQTTRKDYEDEIWGYIRKAWARVAG